MLPIGRRLEESDYNELQVEVQSSTNVVVWNHLVFFVRLATFVFLPSHVVPMLDWT